MNTKKILYSLLVLIYLLPCFRINSVYAEEQVTDTLVVYDSVAYNSSFAGNIDNLKRLLSSFNLAYTVISSEKYQPKELNTYKNVIIVQNINETTPFNDLLKDDLQYFTGKYMHIGYNPPDILKTQLDIDIINSTTNIIDFSADNFNTKHIKIEDINLIHSNNKDTVTYGNITINSDHESYPLGVKNDRMAYLSFFLDDDITSLYSSFLLHDWLNITDSGNIYVLINEIYPYSDLNQLVELAETMYNAGIPFIASVNPIFSNLDYPAAKVYLESLKMMQFYNGSIIVDAPTVTNTLSADRTIIQQKMELFLNWLMENGVAPLGTSAQLHWFFDDYYTIEGMSFYDSIIMLPNQNIIHYQPTNYTKKYESSLYMVSFSDWQSSISKSEPISDFPTDVAITLNYIDDFDNITSYISEISQSWISIQDYRKIEHHVKTNKNTSNSTKGLLALNGEILSKNNNAKDVETDYEYYTKTEATFEKQFAFQNKFFIVVIAIVLVIFTLFLFNGYKLYKKKYVDKGM